MCVKAMFQWRMAVQRSRWPVVSAMRDATDALALADTMTLDALAAPDAPESLRFHVVGCALLFFVGFDFVVVVLCLNWARASAAWILN